MARSGLTNAQFAELWNASASVDEVSTKSGIAKASCQTKAAVLRKSGLTLKKFQKGRKPKIVDNKDVELGAEPVTVVVPVPADVQEVVADNSFNGGTDAA